MKTVVYDLKTQYDEGMDAAAQAIKDGELVAMPTETVYGLAADAMNEKAVSNIFAVKGRPQDNPLIVHVDSVESIDAIAVMTPLAKKLADEFWPGPMTLVLEKRKGVIPNVVTCNMDTVAVRLPKSEYARELIRRSGRYIAAPSANLSGKPSPTRAEHVLDDFSGAIPIILDGGECEVGLESTVCAAYGEKPLILRPGGVTEQMILGLVGEVEVSSAVLEGLKEGEAAQSPGMKYKHYSPKAEVIIADGSSRESLAKAACKVYDGAGEGAVILCMEDNAQRYGERNIKIIGKTHEEMAHSLFDELRIADERDVKTIVLEALPPKGIGLAYMNRALRSAGFKVVKGE